MCAIDCVAIPWHRVAATRGDRQMNLLAETSPAAQRCRCSKMNLDTQVLRQNLTTGAGKACTCGGSGVQMTLRSLRDDDDPA